MTTNPWDDRFAGEGFAYGTEPSRWLVEHASGTPRDLPVLALREGEGRSVNPPGRAWLPRE